MKKILYSMLLLMLIIFGVEDCCLASEIQNPYLIYKNNDFEDHNIGDLPGAFVYHWLEGAGFYAEEEMRIDACENTEIVNIAKGGNNNRAVKISADDDDANDQWKYKSTLRSIFAYYPMKEKGVISFSFMVEDATKTKKIKLGRNAITYQHITYVDNRNPQNGDTRYIPNNWETFISISDGKAYYTGNGNVEIGQVQNNTWYDIDFVFDLSLNKGIIYFNGTPNTVSMPDNTVNIYEVRFDLPTSADDVWYIDDLRIYEADGIVDDAVLDAQWACYTDSSFYGGYEFESGRAANYDYMAFLKCNGKRFAAINTGRFFDGRYVIHMDAPVQYNEKGVLVIPVYDMAKALGAEVTVDDTDGSVFVTYGGRTMQVIPGKSTYYIDGKPAKMLCPAFDVDGTVCAQIDALLGFLGEDYFLQGDILWIDEPEDYNWHMPLLLNGKEMSGTLGYSLEENIYKRILRTLLYDRPSDSEIDNAMSAMRNVHPRIEFTSESVVEIKARTKPDAEGYDYTLAKAVEKLLTDADNLLDPEHEDYAKDVSYGLSNGNGLTYARVGDYFQKWAFAYLMSDTDAEKAKYKNAILHHMSYLSDATQFPDFHIHIKSGLTTGTMAYGFVYAIDWVDWTEEEIAMIENMCRRNILDHALHAYNCSLYFYQHPMTYGEGNQDIISNGAILLLATALYERDPEYYQDIIRAALRATEGGTIMYFPDGEYSEGISYWRYAGDYLPRVIKGLQTSMGTDWGISDVPGVLKTALFPFMMRGSNKTYAFGDGKADQPFVALMMFAADQTGNKTLAEYRKQNGVRSEPSTIDIANWVFDTAKFNQGLAALYDADIYNKSNSTVIMKTGWDSTDTTVAFHGGANNDGHGHYDIGSFQFDMHGVRFGVDLEREDYNLTGSGAYDLNDVKTNYPDGYNFTSGHYYRFKGEGHNTVVANRSVSNTKEPSDSGSYDMNGSAKSKFTDMKFGEEVSFAVLDMTETNDIYECAVRGVKLDKVNNVIYVQDEFDAKTPTDFMWSMHTMAAEVSLSGDRKTAYLATESGKKIKVTILDDNHCGFKFEILPAEFDATYGTSVKPLIETANPGVQKLAVRTAVGEKLTRFKFAIAIEPYIEGGTSGAKYIPTECWGMN